MWVALLEDDPLVARVTARSIERHNGAAVGIAHDLEGFRALLHDAGQPPSVVLLDLDLGMQDAADGVDALHELRARGYGATVAFFTASPRETLDARLHRRGLAEEVAAVFQKPIEVRRIASWLETIDPPV